MWLFDKTPIFLLTSRNLKLLKKDGDITIPFTDTMVKNQEIRDAQVLRTAIIAALQNITPHATTLFLGEEIVYSKLVTHSKSNVNESETLVKEFFDQIPITPNNLARRELDIKGKKALFATNKKLYESIIEVLEGGRWKIKYALPAELILPDSNSATCSDFKKHARKKLLEQGNFLESVNTITQKSKNEEELDREDESLSEEEETFWTQKNKTQVIVLVIMLIILILFITWYFFYKSAELKKQKQLLIPTPTAVKLTSTTTPTPVATTSAALKNKEDVSVQILNGSGTPGQATRAKDVLIQNGFSNVQVGDAQGATATNTIVVFSNEVPENYKTLIITSLKTIFASVEQEAVPDSSEFDVFITTGGNEL